MLIDGAGRVLIAQRPAGKHLAGGWEFPGGKLEPGETRAAGLARELREELGITIEQPRPLLRLRHTYPEGEVLLDVWVVRRYRGEPRARRAGAALVPPRRVGQSRTACRPIGRLSRHCGCRSACGAISTRYYRIVDLRAVRRGRAHAPPVPLCLLGVFCRNAAQAAGAAAAGADFLVMREALPDSELAASCGAAAVPLFASGISLTRAWALGASGINALAG